MSDIERPSCKRCHMPALLRRNLTANGAEQYGWYCIRCENWAVKENLWIKKDLVEKLVAKWGKTLADIPTVGVDGSEPCRICGDPHTEIHHFAPQEFADRFDNWPAWPTGPLCAKHHTQWHELVQGRKIRNG